MTNGADQITPSQKQAWDRFRKAGRIVTFRVNRDLKTECGITLSGFDALCALESSASHRLSITELTRKLPMTRTAVSRLIDRELISAGYVCKTTGDGDKRERWASLTPHGVAVLKDTIHPQHSKAVMAHFAMPLDEDKAKLLCRIFAWMNDQKSRRPRHG